MKTDSAGNRRSFRVTTKPSSLTCHCTKDANHRGSVHEVELDVLTTGPNGQVPATMVLPLCRSHIRELHAATADV